MGKDKTLISAIGAVSSNGAIGLNGWLPWDIPEELAYFESTVAGAALVIAGLATTKVGSPARRDAKLAKAPPA